MKEKPFRFEFSAMGSPCEFLLSCSDQKTAENAAKQGILEVRRIEQKYSRYRMDTVTSRINQAAGSGEWISLDEETEWLINFADTLYKNSEGLFDITSGVLRRVWDFKKSIVPSQAQIDEILPLVGWQQVESGNGRLRLPVPGMELDFGGFGKEYAADAAASCVQKLGISHGYVNLGGDVRVIGPQPDDSAWRIAIQNPRNHEEIVATIPVFQGGLTTSGDYEKYFELNGERYCHILNPKTGMPVRYWRSVSVVAPLAIVAGGCSTIAMLLESKGEQWLKNSGFSYLAISFDGNHICN